VYILSVCFVGQCLNQPIRMDSSFTYISKTPAELLLVFGAVLVIIYLFYQRNRAGHKLPPAMPSLPIVGSLPFLPINTKDFAEFCISPSNKLGKIFSLYLGQK